MKWLTVGLFTCVLAVRVWSCDKDTCSGECHCLSSVAPGGNLPDQTPQFVMLTFDDAVNVVNFATYKKIFMGKKNKADGSFVRGTFFVTHDYTNYQFVHQLHRYGNELAVHTISHLSSTDYWKNSEKDVWKAELEGMRTIISKLALIPENDIVGSRAPFLQTAGDTYFRVLKDSGFTYDSSMPSRYYQNRPVWPYTMDHGFQHDCQIDPCPKDSYGGLWIAPMINWKNGGFFCAMADACVPAPETVDDTLQYLKSNFYRHYNTSKAPFPLFLHQAWLQHEARLQAYLQFVDWLVEKDDVFLVSIKEVIDYIRNPVSLDQYKQRDVISTPLPNSCESSAKTCVYHNVPPGGSRYLARCGECSLRYPWVGDV